MFVSNTSTLILLAKITLLRTFIDNSPKIIIPEIVRKELLGKESFDSKLIEKEIETNKIIVYKHDEKEIKKILDQFHLDEGEAAAFSLFKKDKHLAILTDDGELIKLCKIERIPFICAMSVVLRLNEKKFITKTEALEKMKKLVEIGRYSQEIYNYYKDEVK